MRASDMKNQGHHYILHQWFYRHRAAKYLEESKKEAPGRRAFLGMWTVGHIYQKVLKKAYLEIGARGERRNVRQPPVTFL